MTKKMPTVDEIREEFKRTGKKRLYFDLTSKKEDDMLEQGMEEKKK